MFKWLLSIGMIPVFYRKSQKTLFHCATPQDISALILSLRPYSHWLSTSSGAFVCILLLNSISGDFSNIYQFSIKNGMKLGHLNRHISKSFWEKLQNFAERRQIYIRRGMPSLAPIPVTPRTLFKKNRGGVGSDPPPLLGRRGLMRKSSCNINFYLKHGGS